MSTGHVPGPLAAVQGGGSISADQHLADAQQLFQRLNFFLQLPRSKAYNSQVQAIPTGLGAPTALTFDTNVDLKAGPDIIHSTSINPTRFVAPYTGIYNAVGSYITAGVGGATREIIVLVNGANLLPQMGQQAPVNAIISECTVHSGPIFLKANDYVEFGVFQDSGGPLNTSANLCSGSLMLIAWL